MTSPPEKSIFAGGPLPPPMSTAQEKRKLSRDAKWNNVQTLRAHMTDRERAEEQARLESEIQSLLEARNEAA
ncbi:hypothetical protein K3740_06650 [Ruegeria conchae]|uniref:hypothetical protein n=1 Tax=Ruegeria conchae TaxID=981384 RepID=UPI0021A500E2|nr:hypothetical protein [Ruegeria conchae]UWR04355.1 hypothetical protein K3740_06650 [Ruegeria conchae]